MMSNQNQVQFAILNPEVVTRVLQRIQSIYPNMARSVVTFYMIADQTCARINHSPIEFDLDGMRYSISVRGIDPIFRTMDDGAVIGVNIFLGVSNDYTDSSQAGQVRIVLGEQGDSDYTAFLYLDLSSIVIRSDRQLLRLSEWINTTRYIIEQEIANTAQGINQKRVIDRRRPVDPPGPSASPAPNIQRMPAQAVPDKLSSIPGGTGKHAHQEAPAKAKEKVLEDPFETVAKTNIPAFEINPSTEKINVPKDLFKSKRNKS